jgi:poly [ADP-ribose] polymerase
VFSVDDCTNAAAFAKKTKAIGNRKLLWHGTNVAVVAAILKSGLRIMPHSGGRVGSGVYLAGDVMHIT